MKRIFQHPPKDTTGKKYWRSVEEYADTPEFNSWLEREFPQGAAEFNGDELSRRSFLKLMGASLALAGIGLSGCRRPEAHIVPYTKSPEWLTPGRYTQYATSMPRRRGSHPLLVTTFNGRPTKIEGNPLHALSLGKTDVFSQASILDLYDPDRSKGVSYKNKASSADTFYVELARLRTEWSANGGSGLAFLTDEANSPTRERLRGEITKQFPNLTWATYEPLLSEQESIASETAYGSNLQSVFNFSKADVIMAIDHDFISADEAGVRSITDFARKRKVENIGDKMNRLYVVEHRFTNTGAMADHRLRLPASQTLVFVALLAKELVAQGAKGALVEVVKTLGTIPLTAKIKQGWIAESAKDLLKNAGKSLVTIGSHHHSSLQVIVHAINESLGNVGSTVSFIGRPEKKSENIQALAEKIKQGKISTLVVIGGNPVYNAPSDLKWIDLQKSVQNVIRLSTHEDETSAVSTWNIPQAHYLESWNDGWAADGSITSVQPMILPLFGGISDIQLLSRIAGGKPTDGPELVRETIGQKLGKSTNDNPDFENAWNKFVHDGFLAGTAAAAATQLSSSRASDFITKNLPNISSADELEVVFAADFSVDDGRYANNGWMQECPDPITKMTWANAAIMSPATAKRLGVGSGLKQPDLLNKVQRDLLSDVIQITVNGRQIEAPVLEAPGHADSSITLPLGYGRTHVGKVGRGHGFNAFPLRDSKNSYFATGVKVSKTGKTVPLPLTQDHWNMEGRALVREIPLSEFNDHNFNEHANLVKGMSIDSHIPPNKSLYPNPEMKGQQQWGMAIDLNTCVGCSACVVACQSENNIPVVGEEQVFNSREMHWIRIDRYFAGESKDHNTPPEDPEMLMQPVACMHCENAPCEPVCPVNATVHSEEGLNVMAYNRCIGTRYCANNCPYKVRRFNYFDYNKRDPLSDSSFLGKGNLYRGPFADKGSPDTIKMQKNPNVTVRMRGVMEKCTFCVQRIESAKIDQNAKAKDSANTKVPTDSVKTACQQVCPAEAIVFGDKSDPNSAVSKKKLLPLNYRMLEYLNTQPRVSYLARLRNPNPAMPDGKTSGRAVLNDEKHHAPAGHEAHAEHH